MNSLALRATPRMSMGQPAQSQPYPAQRANPQAQQNSPAQEIHQVQQTQPAQAVLKGPGGCMPDNFYDGPKSDQQWEALFSTDECKRPRRSLVKPYPPPILHSDLHKDCSTKADELIRQFPRLAATITVPNSWYEVYKWFDAYDLYVEGAKHCMNVLQEIGRRNESKKRSEDEQIERTIAIYADEWIVAHRDQVLQSPREIDIFALFWPEEKLDHDMDPKQIKSLRNHLEQRRRLVQSIAPHAHALYQVREGNPAAMPFSPILGTLVPLHSFPYYQPNTRLGQKTFESAVQSQTQRQVSGFNSAVLPQSQAQRQFSGGFNSSGPHMQSRQPIWNTQMQERHRGKSNEFNHNGPFPPTTDHGRFVNRNGRRTVSNTSGPSPRYHPEPVYHNTRNSQKSSPAAIGRGSVSFQSGHFRHGSVSNDARISPPRAYHNRSHDQFEPRERYNGPGNMREVMNGDPRVYFSPYCDNPTYFYVGAPKRFSDNEIYDREPCTARIGNVPKEFFLSHKLKEMMSTCGQVQTIHYLNDGSRAFGCALVTFNKKSSVEAAIHEFNQPPRGEDFTLHVTTYDRAFKTYSRNRANSQHSQGSHGYNRRDSFSQGNNHGKSGNRYSINRPRSETYDGLNFPAAHLGYPTGYSQPVNANGMIASLTSATSETVLEKAALDRFSSGKPLASVENMANIPKKWSVPGHQTANFCLGKDSRKENSPTKKSEKDTKLDEHRSNSGHEPRGQASSHGGKKKGGKSKGSKQNTSTRPTPASSPAKHQSSADLRSMASGSRQQAQAHTSRSSNYLIGLDVGAFEGKQIVTHKLPEDLIPKAEHAMAWKHDRQAQLNGDPSSHSTHPLMMSTGKTFLISADLEVSASPTSTVPSAVETFTASSNLSTSNCSSRHDPNGITVKSDINLPAISPEQDLTKPKVLRKAAEKSTPIQQSKKHKNIPKSNTKNTSSKDSQNNLADCDQGDVPLKADDHAHNEVRIHGHDAHGIQSRKAHQQKKKIGDLIEGSPNKAAPEKLSKHIKSTANPRKINSAVSVDTFDKEVENGSQPDKSFAKNDGNREQKLKKSGHVKKFSTLSATSSGRKSDAQGSKAVDNFNGNSSSNATTPRKSKSAENLLTGFLSSDLEVGNLTSWPALGPSVSPQSSIADGKRPPPISASINTAKSTATHKPAEPASANGVIIPAVPNLSRKSRPQS